MQRSKRKYVVNGIFVYIFSFLFVLAIVGTYWTYLVTKRTYERDLRNTANVLHNHYTLYFNQLEVVLTNIGNSMFEVSKMVDDDSQIRLLNALKTDYSLPFVLTDTAGHVLLANLKDWKPSNSAFVLEEQVLSSLDQAVKIDKITVGQTFYSKQFNSTVIPVWAPIKNGEGSLLAVITTIIRYDDWINSLRSLNGFENKHSIYIRNEKFNDHQLYLPANSSIDSDLILHSSKAVFFDFEIEKMEEGFQYFVAENSFESRSDLGLRFWLTKPEQSIYLTIDKQMVISEFFRMFMPIMIVHVVMCLITGGLFLYFRKIERGYRKEIAREKEYLSEILDNTPTLIIGIEGDVCTYANPSLIKTTGYDFRELIGRKVDDLIFNDGALNDLQNTSSANWNYNESIELPLLVNDDTIKWIAWRFYLSHIKEGGNIIGFGKDITKVKTVENEAMRREANLRALIESTNSHIGFFDAGHRLVDCNKALEGYMLDIHGIKVYKGIKLTDEDLPEKVLERYMASERRALKGEKVQSTWEDTYKNGRRRYFLVTHNPIYNNDEVVGFSLFAEDITAIKDSQETLEHYNQELTTQVRLRTRELESKNRELEFGNRRLEEALLDLEHAQEQMIKSEKMASLGVLAAGVGHEINNPLNFIKNGVSGLSMKIGSLDLELMKELGPLFKIIDDGVSRTTEIVKSLSHYGRKKESMEEICNLHEIIDNCLIILDSKLKYRVEVLKHFNTIGPYVIGNGGKLHQAILNIISNAEEAIEVEGKGRIIISTYTEAEKLLISIEDNGYGISEEHLLKINDPFFTTKPPGQGTGLGLFIAYSIIEEHNGKIEVYSTAGQGTVFTLSLPLRSII